MENQGLRPRSTRGEPVPVRAQGID
jgi:hypothetical protein